MLIHRNPGWSCWMIECRYSEKKIKSAPRKLTHYILYLGNSTKYYANSIWHCFCTAQTVPIPTSVLYLEIQGNEDDKNIELILENLSTPACLVTAIKVIFKHRKHGQYSSTIKGRQIFCKATKHLTN